MAKKSIFLGLYMQRFISASKERVGMLHSHSVRAKTNYRVKVPKPSKSESSNTKGVHGLILGLIPYISLGLLVFMPFVAQAGIIDMLSDLFTGQKTGVAPSVVQNSQTMQLLQATLNSNPNSARGGGDITIVDDSALLSESGPSISLTEQDKSSEHISIYVVRKGDSLGAIAKMFGVSVNTIVWGNDIKNGVITEGQTLVILPISGVKHIVKAGDSIKSIARTYKGDIAEILQYNNLTESSKLVVGDVVIVPDGEIAVISSSSLASNAKAHGIGGPDYGAYYLRPIVGGRKSQGLHGYNGVDLAAPKGTPILASATGDVIVSRISGWNGGYGSYAVIQHGNGTQTLYSHASSLIVFEGSHVVRGQVIGYVGSTGKSTGAHLHFEIRGAKNPF